MMNRIFTTGSVVARGLAGERGRAWRLVARALRGLATALVMRVVMAAVMGLVAGVVAIPMTARAEVTKGYHLGYEQLFSAVCRYVRLDQGGTLVERDSEAGFVIFTWKRDRESKEVRGTFEFVRRDGGDKPTIDLKLTISDAPKYIEEFFFDGLTKKLKKEYPDSEAK